MSTAKKETSRKKKHRRGRSGSYTGRGTRHASASSAEEPSVGRSESGLKKRGRSSTLQVGVVPNSKSDGVGPKKDSDRARKKGGPHTKAHIGKALKIRHSPSSTLRKKGSQTPQPESMSGKLKSRVGSHADRLHIVRTPEAHPDDGDDSGLEIDDEPDEDEDDDEEDYMIEAPSMDRLRLTVGSQSSDGIHGLRRKTEHTLRVARPVHASDALVAKKSHSRPTSPTSSHHASDIVAEPPKRRAKKKSGRSPRSPRSGTAADGSGSSSTKRKKLKDRRRHSSDGIRRPVEGKPIPDIIPSKVIHLGPSPSPPPVMIRSGSEGLSIADLGSDSPTLGELHFIPEKQSTGVSNVSLSASTSPVTPTKPVRGGMKRSSVSLGEEADSTPTRPPLSDPKKDSLSRWLDSKKINFAGLLNTLWNEGIRDYAKELIILKEFPDLTQIGDRAGLNILQRRQFLEAVNELRDPSPVPPPPSSSSHSSGLSSSSSSATTTTISSSGRRVSLNTASKTGSAKQATSVRRSSISRKRSAVSSSSTSKSADSSGMSGSSSSSSKLSISSKKSSSKSPKPMSDHHPSFDPSDASLVADEVREWMKSMKHGFLADEQTVAGKSLKSKSKKSAKSPKHTASAVVSAAHTMPEMMLVLSETEQESMAKMDSVIIQLCVLKELLHRKRKCLSIGKERSEEVIRREFEELREALKNREEQLINDLRDKSMEQINELKRVKNETNKALNMCIQTKEKVTRIIEFDSKLATFQHHSVAAAATASSSLMNLSSVNGSWLALTSRKKKAVITLENCLDRAIPEKSKLSKLICNDISLDNLFQFDTFYIPPNVKSDDVLENDSLINSLMKTTTVKKTKKKMKQQKQKTLKHDGNDDETIITTAATMSSSLQRKSANKHGLNKQHDLYLPDQKSEETKKEELESIIIMMDDEDGNDEKTEDFDTNALVSMVYSSKSNDYEKKLMHKLRGIVMKELKNEMPLLQSNTNALINAYTQSLSHIQLTLSLPGFAIARDIENAKRKILKFGQICNVQSMVEEHMHFLFKEIPKYPMNQSSLMPSVSHATFHVYITKKDPSLMILEDSTTATTTTKMTMLDDNSIDPLLLFERQISVSLKLVREKDRIHKDALVPTKMDRRKKGQFPIKSYRIRECEIQITRIPVLSARVQQELDKSMEPSGGVMDEFVSSDKEDQKWLDTIDCSLLDWISLGWFEIEQRSLNDITKHGGTVTEKENPPPVSVPFEETSWDLYRKRLREKFDLDRWPLTVDDDDNDDDDDGDGDDGHHLGSSSKKRRKKKSSDISDKDERSRSKHHASRMSEEMDEMYVPGADEHIIRDLIIRCRIRDRMCVVFDDSPSVSEKKKKEEHKYADLNDDDESNAFKIPSPTTLRGTQKMLDGRYPILSDDITVLVTNFSPLYRIRSNVHLPPREPEDISGVLAVYTDRTLRFTCFNIARFEGTLPVHKKRKAPLVSDKDSVILSHSVPGDSFNMPGLCVGAVPLSGTVDDGSNASVLINLDDYENDDDNDGDNEANDMRMVLVRCGGSLGQNSTSRVDVFIMDELCWTMLSNMRFRRVHCQTIISKDGRLFVLGGEDEKEMHGAVQQMETSNRMDQMEHPSLSDDNDNDNDEDMIEFDSEWRNWSASIEEYDFDSKEWNCISEMPLRLWMHSACYVAQSEIHAVMDDDTSLHMPSSINHMTLKKRKQSGLRLNYPEECLVVCGGFEMNCKRYSLKLWIFDLMTQKWRKCKGHSHWVHMYSTAIYWPNKHAIVIIGGQTGLPMKHMIKKDGTVAMVKKFNHFKRVEMYDLKMEQWIKLPELNHKHGSYPAVWFNDNKTRIYVCGDGSNKHASVVEYWDGNLDHPWTIACERMSVGKMMRSGNVRSDVLCRRMVSWNIDDETLDKIRKDVPQRAGLKRGNGGTVVDEF